MIVGLLFIAFIWCLRGFLSYKQVVHNSCNMGTRGLPDIYTLSPRACGPRALGVYIRQTTRAHVTTIHYQVYEIEDTAYFKVSKYPLNPGHLDYSI